MGTWIAVFVTLFDHDSLPSPYFPLWWIGVRVAFETVAGWRGARGIFGHWRP